MVIPDKEEFLKGIAAYNTYEHRGSSYLLALDDVHKNWGNIEKMANGIALLLRSWHQNFYRFGDFNFNLLTECIQKHYELINRFRNRDIGSLSKEDKNDIKQLFNQFLEALRGGKRRSPVAVAKALNLLAPAFLPLWDSDIALAYGYVWGGALTQFAGDDYVSFCWKMKDMVQSVRDFLPEPDDRSPLKRIDEFNYSKYTKHWI